MGEDINDGLRLDFDPRIWVQFVGNKITSDAGLLAYRELDERLGLTSMAAEYLTDTRTGKNIGHHLVPFFRQSIYSRLAGYPDINDADQLAREPAMRTVEGRNAVSKKAVPKSSMGRFETKILTHNINRDALERINALWLTTALGNTRKKRIILDMDSSESKVHGNQEGAKYNGHFECVCFHPIFCFNQYGDCEGYMLREGNVSSADRWLELLAPIVARHRGSGLRMLFRGDAGFARPEIYEYLELEGYEYAIRLPANQVLHREIDPLLSQRETPESGRPVVVYHDFQYQAGTWNKPRRVVAKIEWHAGELFPRVGFIVTNRTDTPKGIVHFYNGRGTCEQWIKEG
ncbi:MAG: IS1380 family transposase, partial [Armatimonadetes bacterium]|nr:IS1380 family transposase [Armatimonadota bacterium]